MVVVADKTSELYQKTYWASYNIPYGPPLPALSRICPTPGSAPRWQFWGTVVGLRSASV